MTSSNIKDQGSIQHELDIQQAKPGSSWGSVFSAAASVRLEDVDDAFLERTQSKATPLAGLAELANSVTRTKKRMREITDGGSRDKKTKRPDEKEIGEGDPSRKDKSDGGTSKKEKKRAKKAKRKHEEITLPRKDVPEPDELSPPTPNLEGKMIPHPHKDEQIMVLLDRKGKVVYSGLRRTDDDGLIVIGKIRSSGKIKLNADAFENCDDNDGADDVDEKSFPFPVDPDDHCESPLAAYMDIVPLLELLCPKKDRCKIYDPYYCDGAVKRNLASLGFPLVHNVKEDCYKAWSTGKVPPLDVLVTNPPYSHDHIPKLVEFLSSPSMASKPWFLLMPQWVNKKPYFVDKWDKKAFFIIPRKRYVYIPPKDFRGKRASDVHKKSSPFVSIWYVWGGSMEQTNVLYDCCLRLRLGQQYELARGKNGLRDLRRKKSVN